MYAVSGMSSTLMTSTHSASPIIKTVTRTPCSAGQPPDEDHVAVTAVLRACASSGRPSAAAPVTRSSSLRSRSCSASRDLLEPAYWLVFGLDWENGGTAGTALAVARGMISRDSLSNDAYQVPACPDLHAGKAAAPTAHSPSSAVDQMYHQAHQPILIEGDLLQLRLSMSRGLPIARRVAPFK